MATINYRGGVPRLPDWAEDQLRALMDDASVGSVTVNSTVRSIVSQVSTMYDNERAGHRIRYGKVGKQVVDLIQQMGFSVPKASVVAAGVQLAQDLVAKGSIFSYHVEGGYPDGFAAADLSPGSIPSGLYQPFLDVLTSAKRAGKLKELIVPPDDPAVHVVLVRDKTKQAVAAAQNLATGGGSAEYEGEEDEAKAVLLSPAAWSFLLLAGAGGWYWWKYLRVRSNPSPRSRLSSRTSRALRLRRRNR